MAAAWLIKKMKEILHWLSARFFLCHTLICQGENRGNELGVGRVCDAHSATSCCSHSQQNNALYWRVLRIRKLIAQRRLTAFYVGAGRTKAAETLQIGIFFHLFASRWWTKKRRLCSPRRRAEIEAKKLKRRQREKIETASRVSRANDIISISAPWGRTLLCHFFLIKFAPEQSLLIIPALTLPR